MPFAATWMEVENIILCEVSLTEKDKYHMISLIRGILKNDTNELYLENRDTFTDIEDKLMVTKGERGRRDTLTVWD